MLTRLAILVLLSTGWASAQDGIELRAAVTAEASGDTNGMRRAQRGALEVWIGETIATFSPRDIQSVGLEVEESGEAAISVWLSRNAAAQLAQVTASATGSALAVVHKETVLSAPLMEGGVTNGLVMIVGLEEAEARSIAQSLREEIGVVEPSAAERPRPTLDRSIPARPPLPSRTEPRPAEPAAEQPRAVLDASATAQAFVEGVGRRRWTVVADLLHPDSWAAVRPDAVAMLRFDGPRVRVRDGNAEGEVDAVDVLGRRPTERRPADLGDRDLTALQLAALDALGVWGPPRPPRSVVGRVEDGEFVHVLLRSNSRGNGVSDVSAITLKRDGSGRWRVLLTEARGF